MKLGYANSHPHSVKAAIPAVRAQKDVMAAPKQGRGNGGVCLPLLHTNYYKLKVQQ